MKKECLSPLSINLKTVSPRGVDAPLRPPAPKQHQGASSPGCGESHQLTSDDSFGSAWRKQPFPSRSQGACASLLRRGKTLRCTMRRMQDSPKGNTGRDERRRKPRRGLPGLGGPGEQTGRGGGTLASLGNLAGSVFAVCAVVTWAWEMAWRFHSSQTLLSLFCLHPS